MSHSRHHSSHPPHASQSAGSPFVGALVGVVLLSAAALAQQPTTPGQLTGTPPPVAGAIYLDPWQIEKEFIISPLALQTWFDLGLTAESQLDQAQREAMKPKIGTFLAETCPVLIGGDEIEFTLDRIHFVEPSDLEFALIEDDAVVAAGEVRISAVFAAPNTRPEDPLQLLWNLFPEGAEAVPITVADVAGSRLFQVRPSTPAVSVIGRYEFGAREPPEAPPAPEPATLEVPWLTILLLLAAVPVLIRLVRAGEPKVAAVALLLALAGGAAATRKIATVSMAHPFEKAHAVSAERSAEILDRLLRGIYHAFDYRDQSEQYDILAQSVGGDALEDIFLEMRRTVESRERDGSRVRVADVKVEQSEPAPLDDRRGFRSECAWEVRGRVGHWGHFHNRANLYRATFTVEPLGGTWKITGLTLHGRERELDLDPAP